MHKTQLLHLIIEQLAHDLSILLTAAKTAHVASTHEENIADNKYETLALEASYVAQGQANRAQEIKQALDAYKQLVLLPFDHDTPIRLTALVTLEAGDVTVRTFFVGPREGGLKITDRQSEIVVITPASPLGRDLIGKSVGDLVTIGSGAARKEFEITEVE